MSKNAMAGAVTLCGVGLCMIGGTLLMHNGQQAHAAAGRPLPLKRSLARYYNMRTRIARIAEDQACEGEA